MLEMMLGVLYSAAVKFTPTTKDDEILLALQQFVAQNPQLLDKAYDLLKRAFTDDLHSDQFKRDVLDLAFNILRSRFAG